MRRGVGKDGKYLYPAMPYIDFTKISDADIHALYAYFRTVKPVKEKTKPADMKFPFGVRTGIAAWQAMYFKQGRYVDDGSQTGQWNRGAYLVQGLGHCDACHTPTNLAMAPKEGKALQGNVVDHWFAPNISGDQYSGIKDWSQADLVTYLKTGHNKKNDAAVGPMAQTIDLGLSHLDQDDVTAIAFYLKNQKVDTAAAPKTARAVTVAEKTSGKQIYTEHCESCHGADGRGVNGIAPSLVAVGSTAGAEPQTAIRAVLQGFEPQAQWGVMPSFSQVFTAGEVSDVVNYVRTAWGNNGGGRVDPSLVNSLARYSDLGDSKVESALICPSASARDLDTATLAEVKALRPRRRDESRDRQAGPRLPGPASEDRRDRSRHDDQRSLLPQHHDRGKGHAGRAAEALRGLHGQHCPGGRDALNVALNDGMNDGVGRPDRPPGSAMENGAHAPRSLFSSSPLSFSPAQPCRCPHR